MAKIIEKDATIRSLNSELAKKEDQVDDLKKRIQQLMAASGQEPEGELRSNKDLVDYLSKVLKAKELQIETQ